MSEQYVGQADPSATASEFNALVFLARRETQRVNTAKLVKIIRAPYDKNGADIAPGTKGPIGFVDVQPLVNQIDGADRATEHGTVYRLKYFRFQGTHGAIISDPVKDDVGKMVIADRDGSAVIANGGKLSNPGSRRIHDFADGTYFGQCIAETAPTQCVRFTERGVIFEDKNSNILVMDDLGFSVTDKYGNTIKSDASGWLINGALIKQNGDVVTKHGTSLDNHVNTAVMAGGDNTGPPP